MKNKIYIIISLFIILFYSCKKENQKNHEKENTYKILSVLYNDVTKDDIKYLAFPPSSPPAPNSNANWDSIKKAMELDRKIEKDTVKIIDALLQKRGRLIVAINPTLFVPSTEEIKIKSVNGFDETYQLFEKIKDTTTIKVSKISINKYSYILPYQNYYKNMSSRGFDKYDIVLNFSRIAFNKNSTKAIVIMGAGFGKLNGFSAIYFLEKKNKKWYIKEEIGLSIS